MRKLSLTKCPASKCARRGHLPEYFFTASARASCVCRPEPDQRGTELYEGLTTDATLQQAFVDRPETIENSSGSYKQV